MGYDISENDRVVLGANAKTYLIALTCLDGICLGRAWIVTMFLTKLKVHFRKD